MFGFYQCVNWHFWFWLIMRSFGRYHALLSSITLCSSFFVIISLLSIIKREREREYNFASQREKARVNNFASQREKARVNNFASQREREKKNNFNVPCPRWFVRTVNINKNTDGHGSPQPRRFHKTSGYYDYH